MATQTVTFSIPAIVDLSNKALMRAGVSADDATIITQVYLEAELRGRKTHGFRLIPWTLAQMKGQPIGEITTERETPVSALLNGGHRHGCAVAHKAMSIAIAKAQQNGIGVVGIHNAGNIGMAGYYARLATDAQLIGIVMGHTPAVVVPFGGSEPILGTNPLAVGIPAAPTPIVLDMGTSAIPGHQVLFSKATGQPLPPNVALDKHGQATTDANAALEGGLRLLPFGGHKGSGLAMVIEILAGCWTNSPVGAAKSSEMRSESFGSLFIAMQPDLLLPAQEFQKRVHQLIERIKNSRTADGFATILLPGERGQKNREKQLDAGVVEVDAATAAYLRGETRERL